MRAYTNLVRAGLRSFFRERQQVFWSFFFPLFFIVIFGTIFSRAGDQSDMKFKIGLVAPKDLPPQVAWAPEVFRSKIPVFQTREGSLDSLKAALKEGDLRAIVVFPNDFAERAANHERSDVRVITDETQPQISQAVAGIVQNALAGINDGLASAASGLPPAP